MLQPILDTVRAAGEKMLGYSQINIYQKEGHANFVTQADMEVQDFLLEKLHLAFPYATFFAEEQENGELTGDWTFVIDPIDGTTNFMRGRNCSSISVALLKDRQPVIGVILNPYEKELFHAEKGKGAYVNGTPIHVTKEPFSHALVSMGTSPYDSVLARKTMRAAETFLLEAADLRRSGSAAIDFCDVACGRSDVYWELILSPWDFAAGALIVAEAGGVVGNPAGEPLDFGKRSPLLAANPLCYKQAEAILQKVMEK